MNNKLFKKKIWYLILAVLLMILVNILVSFDSFAKAEIPSQGSTSFFGTYEDTDYGPNPTPDTGTSADPNTESYGERGNNYLANTKNNFAGRTLPKTGEKIENFLLPGLIILAITFLVFLFEIRRKENQDET